MIYPAQGEIYAHFEQYSQFYCVYEHWAMLDANASEMSLIYVGCTKLVEVFSFIDARKNTEWRKMVKLTTPMQMRLIRIGDREDCMIFRYNHARIHKAHCNVYGIEHSIHQRIVCNETNETFDTMGEVVIAHSVSQSQLSNHLAGKRGYRTVKGHTYRYERK